ncbi:glycoside hydrolase N-terminal domain-containing protein [Agromyces sp. Leaf222]|uniref:glycosyl hydrolase family 95 catalytic domain-containing protein n=1 Tax=Agromyces sp. Leaf222 TaxID=1735688 RepID=UPI0009E72BC2|nr:glycoside hydrolase N-terminal domain-containing protein [Agromyces sp. Leaf222]
MLDHQLDRRSMLQLGSVVALAPFVPGLFAGGTASAAASPLHAGGARAAAAALALPEISRKALWYGVPATNWETQALPIGNARMGAMLFGNPDQEVVAFSENSFWGGLNDWDGEYDTSETGFGSYRDFGAMKITFAAGPEISSPGGPYTISGGEGVLNTIDGTANTKWCIIGPPSHVLWQADLPSAAVVSSYSITSANDVPARDPQDWVFQGSNDGVAWVALDTRTGPPFEQRKQTKTFTFANTTPYTRYRLDIVPKAGVSHFQVSEIALGGVDLVQGDLVYATSPSGHSGDGDADLARSIDGDAATAWRVADAGPGARWQLQLTAKRALTNYVITSAADTSAADPRDWVLEASNDGATWQQLDSRTGTAFASRGEAKEFAFANTTAYSRYRLTFTAPGAFQVAGIAFTGSGFDTRTRRIAADYRRSLDTAVGLHHTRYALRTGRVLREAFASRGADLVVLRYTTDDPAGFSGAVSIASGQANVPVAANAGERRIGFEGALLNGLRYAAVAQLVDTDGEVGGNATTLTVSGATTLTILLDARTDYKMSAADGWRGEAPLPKIDAALAAASARSFDDLRDEHTAQVDELMSAAAVNWGDTDAPVLELSTVDRLARYQSGAADPTLEQAMFDYGRYLLLSSSKADGLPANLQGLWNNQNQPAWGSDYHTNINIQMNYWAAETGNLSDSHLGLARFIEQVAVPSRVATRNAFGQDTPGWTARTSQSIFGGNGWEWNTVSSAWYALHLYEHWAFTQDRAYLETLAYPMIKEICQFWEHELKELPNGTLVAPNGWSPEHGPREDGVMHDQQMIWDLFENYRECAAALDVDPAYRARITDLQSRLAPNKIGSWGQLQEWQADRDDPNDLHRHTSHLFAVYPGRQITPETPELAAAALVSLKARCGEKEGVPFTAGTVTGDSRRSWTWPWRTALFARLGDATRAQVMLRGLLTYNTLENLFCNHPPFQLDGNFGIPGGVIEMLLQSHGGLINLLPATPDDWATGSFAGLRARGGYGVSATWADGVVTSYDIVADRAPNANPVIVRVNGEDRRVRPANPSTGQPMQDLGPAVALAFSVDVTTRLIAGKRQLVVKATNEMDVPVSYEFETPYGIKAIASVKAGKNALHSFSTRLAAIPAGSVRVTATGTVGGAPLTTVRDVAYEAAGA